MKNPLIIATRGSDLALWQSRHIQSQLIRQGIETELLLVKTKGDIIQDLSFDKMEGKGFFTKEIEEALLHGEADLAVHSYKDLETSPHDGLVIAAVSERADASELLLVRSEKYMPGSLIPVAPGSSIGTSSVRRKSQIRDVRPDLILADLRGNVPTRVEKVRRGDHDAIVLAKAGIDRLNLDLSGLISVVLPMHEFVPAPAQGFLAIQCRRGETELIQKLEPLNHPGSALISGIERRILHGLGGGCHVPLGVHATQVGNELVVEVAYAPDSGTKLHRMTFAGNDETELTNWVVDELKNCI